MKAGVHTVLHRLERRCGASLAGLAPYVGNRSGRLARTRPDAP